ncbi:Serine/threonine-protein kinase PrkC [Stieleria maiorica]|uniref:Serine/threonine-protein kinase PrkC n=1 Tax=Stieleria maiorica TaxID=2795974 RepID=A0A5B9MLE9_9BACT|nr:serine/threonine-protein kinase [Stieleria maiorica]QEG00336.1 Serine/threonine-protein kinase PrkC [Stieleria maiorica]
MDQPTVQYPVKHQSANADPPSVSDRANVNPQPGDWTGRLIGEYEIQKLIGQGAYGQVYFAVHRWLKLPVAIKVLQHVDANDQQSLDRFRREAQIAARLRHPNLVRCTDGGIVGDKLFLATDFVDGEDLRTLVRRRGPLGVAEASEIIRQTSVALQFIVDNDTIHRDIKPANIMLDRDGTVRVLDLGLARCSVSGETLTETGQIMGTLDYLAPEQAVDARRVDFRADLYSLGCTFYYLLTGQAPFSTADNSTMASKIHAHLESPPPPIKNFRCDVPRSVIALIDQMLEKSPERRPDSFRDVCRTLAPVARPEGLARLLTESGENERQATTRAARNVSRWTQPIASAFKVTAVTLLRLPLVITGFLERRPPQRAGQTTSYQFSFRWLKSAMALGFLGLAIWYSGIEIVPVENASSPLFEGRTVEPSPVKHSPFAPSSTATHPPPLDASGMNRQPHLQPPPHPHQRHAPAPPPRPGRSQGMQYNAFQ